MNRRMILATLSTALVAPIAVAQVTPTAPAAGRAVAPARAATTPDQDVTTPGEARTAPARTATPGQAAPATGRTATATAQPGATGVKAPVDDRLFLAAAADGGMAEVMLSEVGLQKARDPELKKFSQRMIDDHTRANQELRALAAQHTLNLPTAVDPRAQFCLESLSGLSGEEFDRCFAKAQLVMHMDAVAMFEAEAERGQDPQLKALAAKLLPTLKEHLKMIKPIAMQAEQEKPSTAGAADEQPGR